MKKGDKGQQVRELQQKLVARGFKVDIDGWFDDETENAVLEFQREQGVIPYGVAGHRTMSLLDGKRDPRWLSAKALNQTAQALEVSPAALAAVVDTESSGSGYIVGKVAILFERHVFYKHLAERLGELAVSTASNQFPGICSPVRGGYSGGVAEHVRFKTAFAIDEHSAICATSWGMFQVMGFHFKSLGFDSPGEFMSVISESEDNQLMILERFIKQDANLLKALRAKKWADFARYYNGPAYKENMYDTKLTRAFERFSKVLQ